MRVLVHDRISYALTSRTITDEGYLLAPAHVARTGVQQYLASELGLTDRNPNEIINVYRPPEEVFSPASLATYQHKELTDNHPPEMVSADTYRQYSVGQVVSIGQQSGEFVQIDVMAKDSSAVSAIQGGKVELSSGYYADYVPEAGVTDAGENYEFVQRNIVINHVALVDKARAGHGARIFDRQTGDEPMAVITLDNGRTVEIEDKTAALVEDSIKRIIDRAAAAETALAARDAELEKEKARADQSEEALAKEKEKTSDAALDALVNERLSVHDAARQLVKDFDCSGKSLDQIKREVVTALHPQRDFTDRDMTYINAVFDMDKEEAEREEADEEEKKRKAADSHSQLAQDMAGKPQPTVDARAVIQQQTANAWKTEN